MTIAGDPVDRTAARGAVVVPGSGTCAELPRLDRAGRRSVGPAQQAARRAGLNPIALLDLAREMAPQAAMWSDAHGAPLVERSYELLELTDDVEVWVIRWPVGGHLQLHDHGGSSGAFWVVGGSLEERYVAENGSLRERHVSLGGGTAFGPRYVHDVRNGGVGTATSVHAYSPPMPGMTFYRTGPGGLVAERAEYRSDPSWAP